MADLIEAQLGLERERNTLRVLLDSIPDSIYIRDNGGRYYQAFGARTFDGRNTGEKWVLGASVTVEFGGK